MAERAKRPPGEALVDLRRRLSLLSPRDPGRTEIIARAAQAYGISVWTMYRALRELNRPKSVRRADHGTSRIAPQAEMERYAEIVAALKIRTTNRKRRHLSTAHAIELLENEGVETPDGLVKVVPGLLKRATIDGLLRSSGLDYARVTRPTAAVRFQARHSNELWHFDMSPSDLKQVEAPLWVEEGRGKPTLMLFSVVDDRSGVNYEEYRCVYGEDAESALRFLFNAFAAKPEPELPFQGIPTTIHMDNGPVSRSRVFQSVMGSLGIRVLTHLPPSEAERRTPARAKGKVERPFRTIKEVHETLYHFHKPKDEEEANLWLRRALVTYNNGDHRFEPHARIYDLSPGDRAQVKIPKQAERRERDLRDIMKKGKRPVVLVVDEAHDLHHKTLTGLKRLMEVVADAGVLLSVLLVGHPRLRNDLRRPQMEEIGYRTTTFDYEGIGAARRDYVAWLLKACAAEGVKIGDLMDEDAIDLVAERLRTPLQIEMHLTLAFEQGFRFGAKPVTGEIVEQVLSRAIDDLEPTLTRNGYDQASLAIQLNARPSDVRAFLAGTLDPEHTFDLTERLRQAGVPV